MDITWQVSEMPLSEVTTRCPTCGAEGTATVPSTVARRPDKIRPGDRDYMSAVRAIRAASAHAHLGKA